MEHEERYYLMMMDALDGALADADRGDLEAHLSTCPDCRREWQTLSAIEWLFRQTPLLMPAVDFAERTLARLPNRRARAWALGTIYAVVLLSGLLPVLLGIFLVNRYSPVLSQPALVEGIWSSLTGIARVVVTVVEALLAGAGRFVVEQPAVVGWLIILAGVVFLWGGVLQRLVVQPADASSRN
ncbi:anti-sigma factor [Promineifilum sp.]|uniref:anti-sigma factor family protein n=1 Tax=Promineifilum sp. TaxID=2664178 RepID=UPI0035B25B4B